jgi:hypothetical protein
MCQSDRKHPSALNKQHGTKKIKTMLSILRILQMKEQLVKLRCYTVPLDRNRGGSLPTDIAMGEWVGWNRRGRVWDYLREVMGGWRGCSGVRRGKRDDEGVGICFDIRHVFKCKRYRFILSPKHCCKEHCKKQSVWETHNMNFTTVHM